MTNSEEEFTGWRAKCWPIHPYEFKKFLPTALIMFCILFNYTVLRDTKDALVANATGGSAIMAFLKLFVMPSAVIFVVIYAKLTNIFSDEKLFYIIMTPFLVFFGLFGFVLYPYVDCIHPARESIQHLQELYPRLHGFFDVYGYWTYSLFYILSEIWGSAMIALMFWQYANRITRMKESSRFYPLFATVANTSLWFSGAAVWFFSKGIKNYIAGETWGLSLKFLCGLVVVMGILSMWLYRWMHQNVLNDPLYYDVVTEEQPQKKKKKPGLIESVKIIFTSKELGYITILVMAYGVSVNLVELQWKNQLYLYCQGDSGEYNAFMGINSAATGVVAVLCSALIGSNVMRRFSWLVSALITPLLFLFLGSLFFGFVLARDFMMNMMSGIVTSPIAAGTFIGLAVVVISKSIKYVLFDPTKEVAYIPLDKELKTKGKAAVDVIGGRAGKGGGALVQSFLLILLSTKDVLVMAPYTFVVFIVICGLWVLAVKGLSVRIKTAAEKQHMET